MKWNLLRVAAVTVPALLIVLFALSRSPRHGLTLKTYFTDGMGLRPGAPVRLAGIDIGIVSSVRPRPELKEAPAEVTMSIKTAEELRIPNDSTASLSTAGVLGETYVNIDTRSASGPPIESGATLKAAPTTQTRNLTIEQILNRLAIAVNPDATAQTLDKLEALIKERCGANLNKGTQEPGKKPGAKLSNYKKSRG